MWIDDHVGHYSLDSKWQVLLAISHTAGTLLSVTTGELISDLWHLDRSHFDFDEAARIIIGGDNDLIDVAFL